jgi:hypothetical protein
VVFIVHTFASFGSSTNILLLLWWCVCCLVARAISVPRGLRGQMTVTSKLLGGVYIKAERKTVQFFADFLWWVA